MKTAKIVIATLLAATTMLSGCANTGSSTGSSSPYYSGADYGVIDSIESVHVISGGTSGSSTGAGAIIGGVVGGVLGSQVGAGTGRDVATAAGVVGGAVVGNEMEKSRSQSSQQDSYRIRVRLDNGRYQTMTQQSVTDLRIGDRVRIENGRLFRY